MSRVTCRLSLVSCNLSPVTCHLTTTVFSFRYYESPRILGGAAEGGLMINIIQNNIYFLLKTIFFYLLQSCQAVKEEPI